MRDLLTLQDRIQALAADLNLDLRFAGLADPAVHHHPDAVLLEVGDGDVQTFDEICHTTIGDEPDGFAESWSFRDPFSLTGILRYLVGQHRPPQYIVPTRDLPGLLARLDHATTRLATSGGVTAARRRRWLLGCFYLMCLIAFLDVRYHHFKVAALAIVVAVFLHGYAGDAEDDIRVSRWLRDKVARS